MSHHDAQQTPAQVRGAHAPAPSPGAVTWSPAAAASIAAAAAAGGHAPHDEPHDSLLRRLIDGQNAREKRLLAAAKAAGVAEEREAAAQRVYAWAATLSKVEEALIAAKAAEIVQAGR